MHLPAGANDRINGAGRQTFHTTDASILVDDRDQSGTFGPVGRIERQRIPVKQVREGADRCGAAGRALIDLRQIARDRFGVLTTRRIAATRALRLRQERVDFVGYRHIWTGRYPEAASRGQVILIPGNAPSSGERMNNPGPSPLAARTIP